MATISNVAKGIPVLMAVHALAGVYMPPIPADLTTPVQQRLAITSPGGEFEPQGCIFQLVLSLRFGCIILMTCLSVAILF